MKRLFLLLALLTTAILLSGCSSEQKNENKREATIEQSEWAASDMSIHTVSVLPPTEISKRTTNLESDIIVNHIILDTIPVYELYSKETKLSPVLFFLHEHEGNKEQYLDEANIYAQAGFFCVLFDLYGYGERTTTAAVESIEASVIATQDINLLLEYYRLSPHVDSDKFVLYGHSMGGSAAWHYAAFGGKKPLAMVVCSASADFTTLEDMGSVINGKLHTPVWEEADYRQYCNDNNPINNIDSFFDVPMLVYQGMNDPVISFTATQDFERKVSPKNRYAVFVYDEAGGHDPTVMFLNRILPFIKTYAK